MAIDTAERRHSALTIFSPWHTPQLPDTSGVDTEERVNQGMSYNGIAIDAPVLVNNFTDEFELRGGVDSQDVELMSGSSLDDIELEG